MRDGGNTRSFSSQQILDVVKRFWGYDRLRPLQEEAIQAGLAQRDSLVVLPTGGGKSLCYQVPPVLTSRTDVVVSPLIALMKDQVDGLRECGYPAIALHSGLSPVERDALEQSIQEEPPHLIMVSPERLFFPRFLKLLRQLKVRALTIDEAHCISQWGHDFRPEYRQLAMLRTEFPDASVHAFTATATERVREDIVEQLSLSDPEVLVGTFDRPNLVYRVVPRVDTQNQIAEIVGRHANQAVIVYCISRKDTEQVAASLVARGVRATYYHAGLDAKTRHRRQEQFAREQVDVVAATVAFGMGIDRSDVRCVIHAAAPKSLEHYQQETGRAGRDGLEAECVLLYSPADAVRWTHLIERSAEDAESPQQVIQASLKLLSHMRGYAGTGECRHRALSEYFGQSLDKVSCEACDVCLGEMDKGEDATVVAQKILSCVARVEQRFGVTHIVKVLTGSRDKLVRSFGHDKLTTYGLLKELPPKTITNLIHQLVDRGLLERTHTDRPLLKLNHASWEIMHGKRSVQLVMPRAKIVKASRIEAESWEGVDRGLFERLRTLRSSIASERGIPAYLVLGDVSLREMARRRPKTREEMLMVHGVGEKKLRQFGSRFLEAIDPGRDGDDD